MRRRSRPRPSHAEPPGPVLVAPQPVVNPLQAVIAQLEKLAVELGDVQVRSHANARAIVDAQEKLRAALTAVRHSDARTTARTSRRRKPA